MQTNSNKLDMFVSEVRRQHSALRYLWPFWSRPQLIGVVVTGAVFGTALALLTGQLSGMAGYVVGGLVGGLAGRANRWMPAQLILTTRGDANQFIADVDALLLRQGYARSYDPAPDDGCVHYRSLAPKWANWGEQGVTVRLEEHQITLDGPIGALWLAHHRITRRDQSLPD
jgi:hypothetical protein